MKQTFAFALLLTGLSAQANACPEVAGNYLCAEEAADPLLFNQREISIESEVGKVFLLKAGESSIMYELGLWNRVVSEVDFDVMTTAECSEDQLTLKNRVTDSDFGISVPQDYVITPNQNGINMTVQVDGMEFLSFDCEKL